MSGLTQKTGVVFKATNDFKELIRFEAFLMKSTISIL
jgi:hypothetical protein